MISFRRGVIRLKLLRYQISTFFFKSVQKSELTEVSHARHLKGDDALLCITGVNVRKKQDKVCVPVFVHLIEGRTLSQCLA